MSDQTSSTSRPGSPVGPLPEINASRPYRFTWDATSRRAGPASVSGTSEGRGDYITSNPRALPFNVSSLSLTQGTFPEEWSSSKQGFNAISTVLNSPYKRSAPPKAHAAVPPVPPSNLPRVRRKDFEPYLQAITSQWEQFERNAAMGHDGSAQSDLHSSQYASSSAGSPTTPRLPRMGPGKSLPPLETVPSVFFEPNFNLGDPRTFASVTEQQEGGDDSLDPTALTHSLPLLEKLSHHADTIELHLIREISLRSSSFFAALTNLRDLQTESEQCLERIHELRRILKDVDEKSAKRGLQVVQLESKLKNLGSVQEGVKTVHGVGEVLGVAKGLVSAGEWGEALDVVDGLQGLWDAQSTLPPTPAKSTFKALSPPSPSNGRLSPLPSLPESPTRERRSSITSARHSIPLSSLQSFASLPDHLRTLTFDIATSLTSELVSVLKIDFLMRINTDSFQIGMSAKEPNVTFNDKIRPLLQGLKRTRGVREAVLKWRDVMLVEIKGSIKRHLPSSEGLDEDDSNPSSKSGIERGAELRRHLRSMPHSEFLPLLGIIFSTLHNCIQGIQTQSAALVEVTGSIQSPDSALDLSLIQADLSDILSSATEIAHSRASKVIGIRAEQHASLALASFMGVFSETWNFVIQTEVICRRMIVGLRGVIAKAFLQTLHAARIAQSAKLVEDEQWAAVEVTPAVQEIVNVLVDSAVLDPPALVVTNFATAPLRDRALTSSSLNGTTYGTNAASSKHLRIEDRSFFAVSATLQTLILLSDYLKIIINLSLLTTDAVGRVIEFLKAFNSRTCQVVLGAGAMRSAGLKNITAKHLALASQSISIVVALIPYVRETFRRHLNPKQAVMLTEFDKLKRDYQEHQNEIHAKLIAIMGDRLSAHCKSLQIVSWDTPRTGINEYMEMLVKETVTLHKVLSRYLPEQVVEYVMSQVFASINHRLSEEYANIELPSQEAKDSLLRDVRFLHQKLTALKKVGTPTAMLETVVLEKPVPRKPGGLPAGSESANERIKGIFARSVKAGKDSVRSTSLPPASAPTPEKAKDMLPSLPVQSPPEVPEKEAATQSQGSPPQADKALPDPSTDETSMLPARHSPMDTSPRAPSLSPVPVRAAPTPTPTSALAPAPSKELANGAAGHAAGTPNGDSARAEARGGAA